LGKKTKRGGPNSSAVEGRLGNAKRSVLRGDLVALGSVPLGRNKG